MKNKNDKRGKSPANFYDRIAEMLNKAAIPQTITVEAEGVSPFSLTKTTRGRVGANCIRNPCASLINAATEFRKSDR